MVKLFFLTIALATASSYASDFNCVMERNSEIKIIGNFTNETALIQIEDKEGILEIRELFPSKKIEMQRSFRKNEDKYSFAKYYSDFSAWQDIEISIPKNISSNTFKAFLTVYTDNGNRMVPDGGNRFSCVLN